MRIAFDTGGTFTDCVFVRDGRLQVLKVSSTPPKPSDAIAHALEQIWKSGGSSSGSVELACGTTVGTNALLQRKGGRVALVTTEGFEDVLEIGRQARPQLYNLLFEKPDPLVPRARRLGLRERLDSTGRVLCELTVFERKRIEREVVRSGAESVAVCLLFSFVNPAHEKAVVEALAAAKIPVSASFEILPEYREFERTSTTVVNAYLVPVMSGYLSEIERIAASYAAPRARESGAGRRTEKTPRVQIMQSNGGILSAQAAAREPVRTILSGPAGGVQGAQYVSQLAGFDRIITFDMGGTSTDVALMDDRRDAALATTSESIVSGMPVAVPMLDIHTVGAGGGSLARFDRAGALRVGPESAGADPGPICYGRGEKATVTDANLVLGRVPESGLLGGAFHLDLARTRRFMNRERGTMRSVEAFAQGIVEVANAVMEKAIRVISVERGHDPRDYTLVAFGGAGGLHACELAAALEIPRVLVPCFPGALSALGILRADVTKDLSRTIRMQVQADSSESRVADHAGGSGHAKRRPEPKGTLSQISSAAAALRRAFSTLEDDGRRQMRSEGFSDRSITLQRSLDMRYAGQSYELSVPFAGDFVAAFHRAHEKRYGYCDPARACEVVNIRARFSGRTPKPALPKLARGGADARAARIKAAQLFVSGQRLDVSIYDRSLLRAGNRILGPAIATEYSATTLIPPGWAARVDSYGNLILEPHP